MAIIVWTETKNGKVTKAAREAAQVGHMLAEKLGSSAHGVIIGSKADNINELNLEKVIHIHNDSLTDYSPEGYASAIHAAGNSVNGDIYVMSATALGRDLAPRLAARLNAALATDITGFQNIGEPLTVIRPVYSGKLTADVELNSDKKVISIRPNAFGISESSIEPEVTQVDLEIDSIRTQIQNALQAAQDMMDVTEAEIIVAGGRGVKGPEGFETLETFARSINAALGASRVAVDEGWIPYKHQVGQTGKVVSPVLYIACGISGAIQHFAGMGSSKFILAINSDAEAPIMKKADFAIEGDLFKVIPILQEEMTILLNK